MKNNVLSYALLSAVLSVSFSVHAENLEKNTARMQAMDKITGRVSVIDVPVDGKVDFGSFSIVVRSCQTRPAEEIPDNFAFVDVTDTNPSGNKTNVFRGWMISSSPATSAVEHPIYDVWLLQCLDTEVNKSLLLSTAELDEINNIPANKKASKNKSVASSIHEMQYQDEQNQNSQNSKNDSEEMLMEFDMDEDSGAEPIAEENSENQTNEAEASISN